MNFRKFLPALLLLILTLVPRLSSLASFVTIDEPFWLSVGANYYYALGQRELENTVYEYHPAVTTMSLITAAFVVDFPDYRGLGQGYFDVDKEKFDPFLIEHGHDPMQLLYLSRLFQVLLIVLFALLIFYLLSLLIGELGAFLVTALISSAPYFLGHSRVLSHEAMVAFFVLASILALMVYLRERKWFYLLISAVSAALAQLTKSSAMAMFPVIALMLTISIVEKGKQQGFRQALTDHLKIAGLWILQLCVAYFILWPGMWVAPEKMLYEVYGNAFSYAFQGARLQVTHELEPSTFSLGAIQGIAQTALGFLQVVILKSTPVTWLGILLAGGSLFTREKSPTSGIFRQLMLYLLATAILFVLLFSVARGRNSSHYIMSTFVSIDAIAALGWSTLLTWLGKKWQTVDKFQVAGVVILVLFQLMSALAYHPYYYTYNNPLWVMLNHRESLSDYGEGFEQAALYLSEKPDAASLKVLAFRGRGAFSYFFPGQTVLLNPLFVEDPGMPSLKERLEGVDYLVINADFAPRTARTQFFMDVLQETKPEHEIRIKGVSPIYIYRVTDLPPSFYDIFSME